MLVKRRQLKMSNDLNWNVISWNPLPQFVEVETSAPQGSSESEIIFCPTVRCHPGIIVIEEKKFSVELSLAKGYLVLELENLDVKNRSRFGDSQKRSIVPRAIETQSTQG